jgi:hypothetical protein
MRVSERDRKTLTIGGSVAVVIVAWVLVGDPLVRRWEGLGDEIRKKEADLAGFERARTLGEEAQELQTRLGREVTSYARSDGYREQMPRLISQLDGLSAYRALNVTRLEPVAIRENPDQNYAECSLGLSFDCSTRELAEFLYEAQRAEPALLVETLKISQASGAGGRLSVNLIIASFAMVEPGGAG